MIDLQIITNRLANGITCITIKGILDSYSYDELEQVINSRFAEKQYKLIIDLSGVDYLGGAGAGILVSAIAVARENNGNIILVCPTSGVKNVFELIGPLHLVTITDNMESAIKMFD